MKKLIVILSMLLLITSISGFSEIVVLKESVLVEATPEVPKILMEEEDFRDQVILIEERDLYEEAWSRRGEENFSLQKNLKKKEREILFLKVGISASLLAVVVVSVSSLLRR